MSLLSPRHAHALKAKEPDCLKGPIRSPVIQFQPLFSCEQSPTDFSWGIGWNWYRPPGARAGHRGGLASGHAQAAGPERTGPSPSQDLETSPRPSGKIPRNRQRPPADPKAYQRKSLHNNHYPNTRKADIQPHFNILNQHANVRSPADRQNCKSFAQRPRTRPKSRDNRRKPDRTPPGIGGDPAPTCKYQNRSPSLQTDARRS